MPLGVQARQQGLSGIFERAGEVVGVLVPQQSVRDYDDSHRRFLSRFRVMRTALVLL